MSDPAYFTALVQQLWDVESALDVLARLSIETDPAYLRERDRLAECVLDEAAATISQLVDQVVTRATASRRRRVIAA
jgi:hypothetical protein